MPDNNSKLPGLREAINRAGGIVAFSAMLGLTHQAVYAWFRRGAVPLHKALLIETFTGVDRIHLLSARDRQTLELARREEA